jgi:hypothetical protein
VLEWRGDLLQVERCARGDVRVQFNVQSQLIIIHLRWLEETTDLHRPLAFLLLRLGRRLLALFCKQLGVVARELLERDKEISQDDLEAIEVRVCRKETIDE